MKYTITFPDYITNFEWHILPMMNPDGYIYTRNEDRFWSKNRRSFPNQTCIGVNLNRNFPSHWNYGPSDPCHPSYKGPFPGKHKKETNFVLKQFCFQDPKQKWKQWWIMCIKIWPTKPFWPFLCTALAKWLFCLTQVHPILTILIKR